MLSQCREERVALPLELEEEVTRQFRKHISGLVEEISLGKVDLLAENRARMLSAIASTFWKLLRRPSPTRARTPAWTTSPKRQASDRELSIATFLPAMR